jgi:hypothetical protein
MAFTDLNIEQSIAKYLADKFSAAGFQIYWWDTKQTVGSQPVQVTFMREIPEDAAYLVHQSETQTDNLIRVPAFTVKCLKSPKTNWEDRQGIGESLFAWTAEVRVEGFADNEKQQYDFMSYFKDWLMHPDIRVELADYHSDLSVANPVALPEFILFQDCDLRKAELLNVPDAARYFIQFAATARYIE